ncbi:MAG TPA: efflux RND transporter periplasmic adaptor subunit [Caulobacteraceae bacterium]|jgi:membrane fusion protein (multidrug efflux system)|nr:efflux RND transporter periplasmic adaptor subunit [Caulobacteraceae bacterium]
MTDTVRAEKIVSYPANVEAAPAKAPAKSRRGPLFAGLGAAVALGAVGYGAWYLLVGSQEVATDNAYVTADTAQVTPLVGGAVREVHAMDTQAVKKGDVLIVIDDTDARLALAQAQAALGQAERKVQGYLANDGALSAQVSARVADQARATAQLTSAQADLQRAKVDLDRRKALSASGAVSGDELTSAQNAYSTALANVDAAKAAQAQAAAGRLAAAGSLDANQVLTRGASIADNPEVAAARARVDQAKVDLERTVIRAPIDGVVAKRQVQIGQRAAPGVPLMSIVPIAQSYVDANFKEVQLRKVKIGQPAELESDLYGGGVKFHGKVVGLAGGTGSSFALIPAQNATGNWIKVVQRVPVRIALDPSDLQAHPLRLGLSMKAKIHTGG